MEGHRKIFSNIVFGKNWSVSLAVMGSGLFKITILSDSTGYNSLNFKDRDLKLVLNERAQKYFKSVYFIDISILFRSRALLELLQAFSIFFYFSGGPHWKLAIYIGL